MSDQMLYLMHTPWGWPKQRMHFLAEELSRFYDVVVYDGLLFRAEQELVNPLRGDRLRRKRPLRLPLHRYPAVRRVNRRLRAWQISMDVRRSRYVWFTFPGVFIDVQYRIGPEQLVVYDCMDDAFEFPSVKTNPDRLRDVEANERGLVARADVILCSSAELLKRLPARYPGLDPSKLFVVNNAVSFQDDPRDERSLPNDIRDVFRQYSHVATYIGTVSEWLDRQLLLRTVETCKDVACLVVGPADVALPVHERICYRGPVEHPLVFPIMRKSSLLMMPVKTTALTRAMNHVKLYEYVYSGVPVVAPSCPETAPFAEYVHVYTSDEEYLGLVEKMAAGRLPPKAGAEACIRFACENTWTVRCKTIRDILDGVQHRG